jgi:hypothetical protein
MHNSLLCVSTQHPKTACPSLVKLFVQTLACFLCPFFSLFSPISKVFQGLRFASLVYVYLLLALAFHFCESQILSSCKPDGEIITLQLGWHLFNLLLLSPCCFRATFFCFFFFLDSMSIVKNLALIEWWIFLVHIICAWLFMRCV